jgi:hypothetical protein
VSHFFVVMKSFIMPSVAFFVVMPSFIMPSVVAPTQHYNKITRLSITILSAEFCYAKYRHAERRVANNTLHNQFKYLRVKSKPDQLKPLMFRIQTCKIRPKLLLPLKNTPAYLTGVSKQRKKTL